MIEVIIIRFIIIYLVLYKLFDWKSNILIILGKYYKGVAKSGPHQWKERTPLQAITTNKIQTVTTGDL